MKKKLVFVIPTLAALILFLAFKITENQKQISENTFISFIIEHIGENVEVGLSSFETVKLAAVYQDCIKITNEEGTKFNILPMRVIIKLSYHSNGNFMIETTHTNSADFH